MKRALEVAFVCTGIFVVCTGLIVMSGALLGDKPNCEVVHRIWPHLELKACAPTVGPLATEPQSYSGHGGTSETCANCAATTITGADSLPVNVLPDNLSQPKSILATKSRDRLKIKTDYLTFTPSPAPTAMVTMPAASGRMEVWSDGGLVCVIYGPKTPLDKVTLDCKDYNETVRVLAFVALQAATQWQYQATRPTLEQWFLEEQKKK